jgi:2-C-methyl-D-erythritol 4-phosphate cytidylyltransferase
MKVAAVILAAGRGERFGSSIPKAFVELAGSSLLARSMRTLGGLSEVRWIQPVVASAELARYAPPQGEGFDEKLLPAVPGGAERQDSVSAGVAALPDDVELIAVHDAARCLVRAQDVRAVIEVAARTGAGLLATPATDTIKRVQAGVVVETPPRGECWIAQTPQVFRADLLKRALAQAGRDAVAGTDDAELVGRLGVPVSIVQGAPSNIKITHPEDLARAEWLLERSAGEDA